MNSFGRSLGEKLIMNVVWDLQSKINAGCWLSASL
jgi:hypothetical protein